MQGRLASKIAIVTGAASGIGYDIASTFVREGARVLLADIAPDVAKLAGALGPTATAHVGDAADGTQVHEMVAMCVTRFGSPTVLVNAAGIAGEAGPLADATEDNFDTVMRINTKSVFLCSRAVARVMLESGGGSIINIASVAATIGFAHNGSYCASKGAVLAFTRATSLEFAGRAIRVNAICPGFVDTPMARGAAGDDIEGAIASQAALTPMRRVALPSDISHAAVYLASEESSYVTGAALTIDGGYTAQ